jgi:steroid delta-isomerase-like uncharacterized protein
VSKNIETIQAFVDAFNRHDAPALPALYTADARVVYPGSVRTPQDQADREGGMLAAIPDYRIDVTQLLDAADDHVLLEIAISGTQRADLGGKRFAITGAYVFKMRDGLIQEERAYPDMAGLRKQLS